MRDIKDRVDIELIVDSFYTRVLDDEVIKAFFTEVVALDWDVHIPVMYDFWETTLLGQSKYKGNPMLKHLALNDMKSLQSHHFDRWLSLWEGTIRSHFMGDKADMAIARAHQIALLMQHKINGQSGLL